MRIFITLLFFSVSLNAISSDYVYKRINPDGTVEYSDKRLEGGEVIKVPKGSTFTLPTQKTSASTADGDPTTKKIDYELTIVAPTDDQSIRSNNGNVAFTASLSPSQLIEGQRISWSLDGQEIPKFNGLVAKMKNVDRGTHELQVNIVDDKGGIIASSETITFHLLRVSVRPPPPPPPPVRPKAK